MFFGRLPLLLKSRMGAAVAPSWAMNISYFRISSRPGGTMIKRLPRGHRPLPSTVSERKNQKTKHKPCCQPVDICFVKDVMGWNVAAVVWENTKNNFPSEMYWLACLCVQNQEPGATFFLSGPHPSQQHTSLEWSCKSDMSDLVNGRDLEVSL